jgi:hypothetical protein
VGWFGWRFGSPCVLRMQIALRAQVVLRFGDRHMHGRCFRLGGDAIVGIPGRMLEFRLLSVAAFRRHTLALTAATIAPSAPPSAAPSPSLKSIIHNSEHTKNQSKKYECIE